jgi:S-adenosylmethionine/arginine decarboxylase-like enzyme
MLKHEHLLVMAEIANPPTVPSLVEAWMLELIFALGMDPLIEPKAVYCDIEGNRGMTCICAIATSHIVLHTWDEGPLRMQLDVYTCSALDLDIVWERMKPFGVREIAYKFYDRSNGFALVDEGSR